MFAFKFLLFGHLIESQTWQTSWTRCCLIRLLRLQRAADAEARSNRPTLAPSNETRRERRRRKKKKKRTHHKGVQEEEGKNQKKRKRANNREWGGRRLNAGRARLGSAQLRSAVHPCFLARPLYCVFLVSFPAAATFPPFLGVVYALTKKFPNSASMVIM